MSLSNTLRYGFHPSSQIHVGNPHITRIYDHPHPGNFLTDNMIDDKPYASYERADLSLEYMYEQETKYMLGSEIVSLPIPVRVYRRDPQLRWSEIRNVLTGGSIPQRYMFTDVDHAPVNSATFYKFANRFYLANDSSGSLVLYEKGTKLPVERQHSDFEWVLELMIPNNFTEGEILAFSAQDFANVVLEHTGSWHLDRFHRAMNHWRFLHRV
ncbi:hypothetical protein B0H17DRAFT_1200283 [Mycena rosella]|uniref:Uncharacterized protein n=1 Tax=Mycena rosella TaxID=1033263 RepID=A0AAD7DIQ7_MYCRO|nr:hypothetical protein B0H17DRAFT_1200283 [Mycena rosella]